MKTDYRCDNCGKTGKWEIGWMHRILMKPGSMNEIVVTVCSEKCAREWTEKRCYQCRRYIIAADDDALMCIECGGRNRRVHVVVG